MPAACLPQLPNLAGNFDQDFFGQITRISDTSNTFTVSSELPAACEGVLAVTAVSTAGPEPSPGDKPAVFDAQPGERPQTGSSWAGAWPGVGLVDRLIAAPGGLHLLLLFVSSLLCLLADNNTRLFT